MTRNKNSIEIIYKHIKYPTEGNIHQILNLVLENNNLLDVIGHIYLVETDLKLGKEICREKIKLLEKITKKFVILKKIPKDIANKFINLWASLSTDDISALLEQIIFTIGPFGNFTYNDLGKSMSVKIKESGLGTDFDVLFFDKVKECRYRFNSEVLANGVIEYHECKTDICSVIPRDDNKEVSKQHRNKMKLFVQTYKLRSEDRFFIPTFYTNPIPQKEYLKNHDNGKYEFIEIIDIKDIKKRMTEMRAS